MAKKRKAENQTYTSDMLMLLEHAPGQTAGVVMPLPEGDGMPAAVTALQALGLLHTRGTEPALTQKGHKVCNALRANEWRWP